MQFTSWAFTRRAHDSGLVPSMGSIGWVLVIVATGDVA